MHDLSKLDRELNDLILNGKALEGFEKFYADDCVMQENSEAPTRGKEANRQREMDFFNSLAEFHGAEVRSTGVGDSVTFSEWLFDVTFKDGKRKRLEQTAVRRWRDGQIVNERFYYNAD
jgi:ketosteroid isomerase-like protein